MKGVRKAFLLSFGAGLLMSASVMAKHAQGEGHGSRHHGPMGAIFAELDLTLQQKQDIRQLLVQGRQDRDVYRMDKLALGDDMQVLLAEDSWNEELAAALLAAKQPVMEQQMWQNAQLQQQIWQLLDETQRQTWLQQMAEPPSAPPHRQQLAARLGLSEERLSQWQDLQAQADAQKAQHQQIRRAFHQAELALIASDNLNEQSWSALLAQYRASFQQMAVELAKQRYQFYQLLDAEQRSKLKAWREKAPRREEE